VLLTRRGGPGGGGGARGGALDTAFTAVDRWPGNYNGLPYIQIALSLFSAIYHPLSGRGGNSPQRSRGYMIPSTAEELPK